MTLTVENLRARLDATAANESALRAERREHMRIMRMQRRLYNLPSQLERARARVAMLEREARELGLMDLFEGKRA